MADGRRASTSGAKRYINKKSKRAKPTEIVELSDSSSCNDDDSQTDSKTLLSTKSIPSYPEDETMDCPICLQTCMHPARLPCGHVFCFLCLKGIAQQSKSCAMCRQDISSDYFDNPDLLQVPEVDSHKESEDEYQWFYEGRNGWWQYDERTSRELETAFKSGSHNCELLIAGFLYTADFDTMLQMRRTEPHRRRRIKRDLATIQKKGVAGIRKPENIDSLLKQFESLTIPDNSVGDVNNEQLQ